MNIVVVGAGYVGLVTAACLAESGNRVVGVDHDPARVLLVGDTRHDHEVAAAMGVDCALIVSGNHTRDRLEETEKAGLLAALTQCRTTREMAARLGISQAGVSRKLRKYNLPPPGGKR